MRSTLILSALLSSILAGCVVTSQMPPKPPRPVLTISDSGCMDAESWRRLMIYVLDLEAGYQ
jgi:hypothetical protein